MNPPAPAPMPSTVMTLDGAFALLPKDEMAARGAFAALYDAVVDEQDASAQMLAAAGVLLCVASEFADFRGLATWLERFASGDRAAGLLWPRPHDQARIAAARLTVPLLDEAQGTDDAVVAAAAERLTGLLAGPLAVSPDERILLSKVLIDYRAHRSDTTAVMRIAAQVQDFIRSGGVSPAWQARWWLLMASNHEYFGAADAAADALARANHLSQSHALHQLRYELLCVEMNHALKDESWARTDVIAREIEKAFPDIRAGRLPAGLRAQAARLLWMREPAAALQRLERLLAICADIEVPLRDRTAYLVQRAYALMALGRFTDAVATLKSQRPYQRGEQGAILEVLIDFAGGLGDVREGRSGGAARLCDAVKRCVPLQFERFLLPLPDLAAEIAQTALDAGVEKEFVTRVIRTRKLVPPDPSWPHWPWRLQVRALGALEVLRDGGPLAISGKRPKKPLELLALLAAQGRKPLPIEAAVATLWASPDGEDRKGSLEVALSRLRKLLGVPGAVMLADGGLRLDLRVVWTDVAEFEALEKRILSGDERDQVIESGAQVLLLFRGVLLAGEALSGPWRTLREQFSRRFLHLVLRHGAALEAQGQWGDAADAYRRGIECDVLAEPLYRALMRAQLQLGERAEALRTFARCRDLLSSMLGVAPTQETWALREQAANLNR